jgi:hypothetical protein
VWFANQEALVRMLEELGLSVRGASSFPLPRVFGRVFVYNETWVFAVLQ